MKPTPDPVEREYLTAIARARDNDEAFELSIGLRQYRALYQLPGPAGPSTTTTEGNPC